MEVLKEVTIAGVQLRVVRGDLTESPVDAIVNAANSHLQHGGGVAGAIVRKGGAIIQEESNRIGYVPVGKAALTSGGRLKARHVIHTVGPRWGEGDEAAKLASAILSTLALAAAQGFNSISMPAVSGGIFGFPKEECAAIIVGETIRFIGGKTTSLREINFCLMDEDFITLFQENLAKEEKR